jgi:hypothetical protein
MYKPGDWVRMRVDPVLIFHQIKVLAIRIRITKDMFFFRPLCGMCNISAVMTTKGCQECPTEEVTLPLRNAAIVVIVFIVTLFWFWYSWSPFFPALGDKLSRIFLSLYQASDKASKVTNLVRKINFQNQRLRLTQYFKIAISYLQVMSSFLGLHVAWPSSIVGAMMWCKVTFNFNLLSLPGISCLWKSIDYNSKLIVYTLTPLCLGTMLLGPFLLIKMLKRKKTNPEELGPFMEKYSTIADRFWNAVMLICFLVISIFSHWFELAEKC